MAQIRTLMQGDTQVLPRTVAEAVSTDAGSNVQAELDALRGKVENIDVSEQLQNYLPLSGGKMTGNILIKDAGFIRTNTGNSTEFGNSSNFVSFNPSNFMEIQIGGQVKASLNTGTFRVYGNISSNNNRIIEVANPTADSDAATKGYVDTQIESIPTPDVSGQIEEHNTASGVHANMGWLTASDARFTNIASNGDVNAKTLDGHAVTEFATKTDLNSVNAVQLEGHPASYFATSDEVDSISDSLANYALKSELSSYATTSSLNNYVLKSELNTLVPQPDLSNYYTKTQVDQKITEIQNLIDAAAALVDEINGEVI